MADPTDADAGLEARIQHHARAFESLLALTPAREYFGSQIADGREPSEQWKRRKQTAEEKRAAKRAKLDPANQVSALEVLREREREGKRKREVEGFKEHGGPEMSGKRPKRDGEGDEERGREIAEKRRVKRREKKERAERKRAKREAKKAAKQRQVGGVLQEKVGEAGSGEDGDEGQDDGAVEDGVADGFDASGLVDAAEQPPQQEEEEKKEELDDAASKSSASSGASSVPSSPVIESPAFDIPNTHYSATSSTSSILTPSEEVPAEREKAAIASNEQHPRPNPPTKPTIDTSTITLALPQPTITSTSITQNTRPSPPSGTSSPKLLLPNIDPEILQSRLRARIDALRAARKADSAPAQSRQDLLEQRRKKEELRRAAKKEARRRAREEEAARREEELKAAGGSREGSWGGFSPRPATNGEGLAYSRLTFGDGTVASANGREVLEIRKGKGPQDPRTALLAAETKQRRLAGYDVQKREEIAEKDRWAQAKQRARGEVVGLAATEPSLLKKALKRQEKAKGKSEKAWLERERKVAEGVEARQKRREGNLEKRREERKKGKGKGKAKAKNGRPGFEGRFKA